MSDPWATIVAAIVGFLGGLVTTILTTRQSNKQIKHEQIQATMARLALKRERERASAERQDERREQHLFDALQYFTGDTQRRGVGISIVEGFLEKVPELRSTLMPLLSNQAIFLLAESGQVTKSHEQDNLRRIMSLILRYKNEPGVGNQFQELRATIETRLGQVDLRRKLVNLGKTEHLKGVEVEHKVLATWKSELIASSPRPGHQPPISCVRFGFKESQ